PAVLVVHPQVALLVEGDLSGDLLEELDRRERQRDVELVAPGRADSARVQLRARVAAAEVHVEDRDRADAALGEVHRRAGTDEAPAHDRDVEVLCHGARCYANRGRESWPGALGVGLNLFTFAASACGVSSPSAPRRRAETDLHPELSAGRPVADDEAEA